MPPTRKPILCYVTDRHALGESQSAQNSVPIQAQQGSLHELLDTLVQKIRLSASQGVDWIQIREKGLEDGTLIDLIRRAIAAARPLGASILVNDRLDCAIAGGADGVHLGETSLPTEVVTEWRRNANGRAAFKIGVSCHSASAALLAESAGADYVFFGPVFATPSKMAFGAPQGIERLREACSAVRIPVLAIGGVTVESAPSCIAAGAAGMAAIRMFQESEKFSRRGFDVECENR